MAQDADTDARDYWRIRLPTTWISAAWPDDTVVLLGAARVRPDHRQIEANPLTEKLPVLG